MFGSGAILQHQCGLSFKFKALAGVKAEFTGGTALLWWTLPFPFGT